MMNSGVTVDQLRALHDAGVQPGEVASAKQLQQLASSDNLPVLDQTLTAILRYVLHNA